MALKPYKKDFGYSYAYGVAATLELIKKRPADVLELYTHVKGAQNAGMEEIRAFARENNIVVNESSSGIDRLTNTENTYAVGVFRKYETELEPDVNHVVLVNPQDKGNLGTICRTMLAFGFWDLAIIKPGVDIFDPKVVRASMGALFSLRFHYFSTFSDYQKHYQRNYYPFITEASTNIGEVAFKSPYSLIFGSESEGLNSTYSSIRQPVSIPIENTVDSLNLSMAVGIGLFEASKNK